MKIQIGKIKIDMNKKKKWNFLVKKEIINKANKLEKREKEKNIKELMISFQKSMK